ncbi:MAG: hypothetical protein CME64_04185 [Halobacteriovoraceae bacterium]|nr:hypothetical protein [Halobacteriovoraceae bacterium]|tara:strand:+ start:115627 stop:116166 length:540 start_codon:yes stop_codon:yes gene_type:complete
MKGIASLNIFLILLLSSFKAMASKHSSVSKEFVKLTCTYTYETVEDLEVRYDEFTVFGIKSNQSINFFAHEKNIPSFFFKLEGSYPEGSWHEDAEFIFKAKLNDNKLSYSFSYLNYKNDKSELHVLKREDRTITLEGLHDDNHASFEYEEGEAFFYFEDETEWIQEDLTKIKDCEIQKF